MVDFLLLVNSKKKEIFQVIFFHLGKEQTTVNPIDPGNFYKDDRYRSDQFGFLAFMTSPTEMEKYLDPTMPPFNITIPGLSFIFSLSRA
jgi:hypothetical protein